MQIRKTRSEDLQHIQSLWGNGDVMNYVGFPEGFKISLDQLASWLNKINETASRQHFSIYEGHSFCGELFYNIKDDRTALIDIKLMPNFWNKGIGTKAFSHLIDLVFSTTDALKLRVDPHQDNLNAIRLYEKFGFEFVESNDGVHRVYDLFKPHLFSYEYVSDTDLKSELCRSILSDLPEWFGLPDSLNDYCEDVKNLDMLVAFDNGQAIGFVALKSLAKDSIDIHVMGIVPSYHRKGIGKALILRTHEYAYRNDYTYISVKTLSESHPDIYYGRTRSFYRACGFMDFEENASLWGPSNPCLIMVKHRDIF